MSHSDPDSKSPESNNSLRSLFDTGVLIAARYRVVRFIARGGMGLVYEVEDETTGQRLALKALKPEIARINASMERFRREIRLTQRVVHPNVCRVLDAGEHPLPKGRSIQFFTMELLLGPTLAEYLEEHGAMSTEEAEPLVRQMVSGLGAAHRAGVAHRDFKPSNVILVEEPEGLRAVITDFGLARSLVADEATLSRTLTQTGQLMGTPAYFAPELLEGERVQGPGDFYALGVVVYEMLTGELPFSGRTPLVMALKRLREPAIPLRQRLPDVEPTWDRLVTTCLQRYPKQRFEKAEDLLALFDGEDYRPSTTAIVNTLLRGDAETSSETPSETSLGVLDEPGPAGLWSQRLLWLGLIVVLSALGVLWWRSDGEVSPAAPSPRTVYVAILPTQVDLEDSHRLAERQDLVSVQGGWTLLRVAHRLPGVRVLEAPLLDAESSFSLADPGSVADLCEHLAVDEVVTSRVAFREGGWWVDVWRLGPSQEIWHRASSVGEDPASWRHALADSLWQAYGAPPRRPGLGARFEIDLQELERLVDLAKASQRAVEAEDWEPVLSELQALRRRVPQVFEVHWLAAEAGISACETSSSEHCLEAATTTLSTALSAARLVAPGDLRIVLADLRLALLRGDSEAMEGAAKALRPMSSDDVSLVLVDAELAWQQGKTSRALDLLEEAAVRRADWRLLAALVTYGQQSGQDDRVAVWQSTLRQRAEAHAVSRTRWQRLQRRLATSPPVSTPTLDDPSS